MITNLLTDYKELFIALLGGLLAIIGTVIGSFLTKSKDSNAAKRKELIDCYAAFFIAYAAFTADDSEMNKAQVISALEVSRLLFPTKVSAVFALFEEHFIRFPDDTVARLGLLEQIREQAVECISKF